MKLFLSSTLCWSYPVHEAIRIANQFNFDGIEIWAEHVWKYQTSIKDINDTLDETNLKATLHASSWDLNLAALNEGIQEQSIIEIQKSMNQRSYTKRYLLKISDI